MTFEDYQHGQELMHRRQEAEDRRKASMEALLALLFFLGFIGVLALFAFLRQSATIEEQIKLEVLKLEVEKARLERSKQ